MERNKSPGLVLLLYKKRKNFRFSIINRIFPNILLFMSFFPGIFHFQNINNNLHFVFDDQESKPQVIFVHEWGLYKWENNSLVCGFRTYSENEPNAEDILIACGKDIHDEWKKAQMCYPYQGNNTKECSGFYLHRTGAFPVQMDLYDKTTIIALEPDIVNCPLNSICEERPLMMIHSQFSIPQNSDIVELEKIYIDDGTLELSCDPINCTYKLPLTDEKGAVIEYWGEYSNGTTSKPKEIIFRNIFLEDENEYHLDIITDKWKEQPNGCVCEWEIFPALNNSNSTLYDVPLSSQDLFTKTNYYILAGKLIWMGIVDASSCSDGGLMENLAASPCGMREAKDQVTNIQNKFNNQILDASMENGIPPKILKGLIGQESQFWRDTVIPGEYGFGHITENGMDQLLLWNPEYFLELCLLNLDESQCTAGYAQLGEFHKDYLIGQSIKRIGTSMEFDLLAKTLKAGCNQTYQIISNITRKEPREVLTYDDLWRMNLGIYTAGAGCIGDALEQAWKRHRKDLSWSHIAEQLDENCQNADGYFENVKMYGAGFTAHDRMVEVVYAK